MVYVNSRILNVMDGYTNGDDMNWLTDYNSPNHLDIIFFGIIWTFFVIEYFIWRTSNDK